MMSNGKYDAVDLAHNAEGSADTICEHAIGTFSSGLGGDTVVIHDVEDELVLSIYFSPFKYCPYCGERLDNLGNGAI